MWYYGLKPPPNSTIYFPSFPGPFPNGVLQFDYLITKTNCILDTNWMLPLVSWYLPKFLVLLWVRLAFGPTTSPPLESNTKRKTVEAQGRTNFCDPLYVEWN